MFSKKKKEVTETKQPLSPKTRKILVSEYVDKQPVENKIPRTTLGLSDVIYENVHAEEGSTSSGQSSKTNSFSSSKGNSRNSKSQKRKVQNPSSKVGVDNKTYAGMENSGSSPSNGNSLMENEQVKTDDVKIKGESSRKRASPVEERKKEAKKKKDGKQDKQDKSSKTGSGGRRESGVFLLSDSVESSVVYDTIPGIRSTDPSTLSVSSTTTSSSRSSSLRTLDSKALLNPEEVWLSAVESRLSLVANGKPDLNLSQFKQALQVKQSFFVDRCFQLFDKDMDGEVNIDVLIDQLRALVLGSQTDKIRFLFNIYNIRGTGKLVKSEVQQVLKSCVEESRLQFSAENLQALTDSFVLAADRNRDGKISFEELRALVERYPTIAENLAISTLMTNSRACIGLDLAEFPLQETSPKRQKCCRHVSKTYVQNNLKKIVFLLFYFFINGGLAAVNAWRYWSSNNWIIVARMCGLCLDFNCTFVVVLMLRRLITSLRATPLVKILPLDQYIMFHKICGYMIALQSVLHTIAHLGNAYVIKDSLRISVAEFVFTTKANIGWVAGTASLTGVALCVVLTIMVILSLPFIRSTGCFEVFYWSHKLYLAFWVLLIIHAQDFWKWFIVPGTVFLIEAISRLTWVRSAYMGRTYIESVALLPSEVTQLVISRPPGFNFRPGDYVFLQIPAITKYEWHPFTISSAPEQEDSLWLHIRTAGYWTESLHKFFVNYECDDPEISVGGPDHGNETVRKCQIRRRASSLAWHKQKPLKARKIDANIRRRIVTKHARVLCHIDGPYGTPSREIFESEHAVLIGSGIGITPFASILQSIVNQFKASCVQCPKCKYSWCHKLPVSVMNLKKVDFIWINRDQRHFEWFVSLLSRLEREQSVEGGLGHILDMHMYMTSAPPKTDMKGLGLQLALDIVHENEKTDLITGLQTRTQAGRPDFDMLFKKIQANAKGRVTVFFCGSPLLGKTLKHHSHKYGFAFRHEYF